MKTFESDNYYAVLQIPPNAGKDEIRHAYRQASALYDEQSVATYALFSDRQRQNQLAAIEKAFETLIDDAQRATYDQSLIDTGVMDAAAFSGRSRRELAARSAVASRKPPSARRRLSASPRSVAFPRLSPTRSGTHA